MFRLYCPQDGGFLTLYMVCENSYNHKKTHFQKKNAGKVYEQNKNVNKAFSSEVLGQYINPYILPDPTLHF